MYGAPDLKAGAAASLYNVFADPRLNHNPPVTHGVLADEPSALLTDRSSPAGARADRPGDQAVAASSVPARKDARADEWDGLESR